MGLSFKMLLPGVSLFVFTYIFTNKKGCDKIYLKKNQKKEVCNEFKNKEK